MAFRLKAIQTPTSTENAIPSRSFTLMYGQRAYIGKAGSHEINPVNGTGISKQFYPSEKIAMSINQAKIFSAYIHGKAHFYPPYHPKIHTDMHLYSVLHWISCMVINRLLMNFISNYISIDIIVMATRHDFADNINVFYTDVSHSLHI